MAFNAPNPQDIDREGPSMPEEGRYDVTITKVEGGRSSKGDPMLTFTETVDNGPQAGHKFKEFLTFFESDYPDNQHPTWRRLAVMMDAAGFEWEPANSIEAFAAQFPLNELRLNVEVVHRYTVTAFIPEGETKYDHSSKKPVKDGDHPKKVEYVEVTKEEYENWPTDDKGANATVQDTFQYDPLHIYQEAQSESELEFAGDGEAFAPSQNGVSTEPEKVGAAAGDDDDLPF